MRDIEQRFYSINLNIVYWINKIYTFESWIKKKVTLFVKSECTNEIIDPSNSVPESVLIVIGEKVLQKILSQILLAMKSEIPCPSP